MLSGDVRLILNTLNDLPRNASNVTDADTQLEACIAACEAQVYNTQLPDDSVVKVKVKSSMARSLPVENLLPQKVGSIINYFQ